jgi:ABC-type Zn uptake system ZnuABC Zn-binding protein ZnuA
VLDLSEGIELWAPAGDNAGVDPHYWMSAPNAIVMVENARDALVGAAPAAADAIGGRAEVLIGRLGAADAEIRALIDEIPADRRKVVTDHDALGYFIEEYGLEFVGSVFPSLDVSADPSARDIEELVNLIRENDVTAIFAESSVNPQLAEAVAAETGATLSDEPLYTDSLGPPGSGADTLDGMLLHNARVIHDGLLGT